MPDRLKTFIVPFLSLAKALKGNWLLVCYLVIKKNGNSNR